MARFRDKSELLDKYPQVDKLRKLALKLAGSQGFYGRVLTELEIIIDHEDIENLQIIEERFKDCKDDIDFIMLLES